MSTVDILLSVYGENPYLPEFLRSLHAQSCGDFRLLYRFDGEPSPETERMLADFGNSAECSDRIHCGFVRSYITLLKESAADCVMFADQDDVWHPEKVAATLLAMRNAEKEYGSESPILVHTDLRVVDHRLKELAPSMIDYLLLNPRRRELRDLMIQNNVTGCTIMINRALVQIARIPAEAISHDWFLAMIAAAFGKIVFLNRPLIDYRQHPGNIYGATPLRKLIAQAFLRRKLHSRLELTQKQTRLFLSNYRRELAPHQIEFLEAWSSNLTEPYYLKRLCTVFRYGFRKNDHLRTWGMWWAL